MLYIYTILLRNIPCHYQWSKLLGTIIKAIEREKKKESENFLLDYEINFYIINVELGHYL